MREVAIEEKIILIKQRTTFPKFHSVVIVTLTDKLAMMIQPHTIGTCQVVFT